MAKVSLWMKAAIHLTLALWNSWKNWGYTDYMQDFSALKRQSVKRLAVPMAAIKNSICKFVTLPEGYNKNNDSVNWGQTR